MSLVLFGFPGCGKTHFGKMASEQANCPFIDTDLLIEKACGGLSCKKIYEKVGETEFRELEQKVIKTLNNKEDIPIVTENLDLGLGQNPGDGRSHLACISNTGDDAIVPSAGVFAPVRNQIFSDDRYTIIALGGGALYAESLDSLERLGELVHLKVSFETALKRIEERGMPAFAKTREELFTLYSKRTQFFEQLGAFVIDVDRQSESSVLQTLLKLREERLCGI